MQTFSTSAKTLLPVLGLAALSLLAGCGGGGSSSGGSGSNGLVALDDSVTTGGLAAPVIGPADATGQMNLELSLPLRTQPPDQTPSPPLTQQQFIDAYSPTQADYDRVQAYAKANGLTITKTWDNRTLLDVSAPVGTVNATFHVHMLRRTRPDGTEFLEPDAAPHIPAALAAIHMGLIGIDNYAEPVVPGPSAEASGR